MKVTTVLTLIAMLGGALIAIPIVRPYWAELQAVQRDCVETKPAERTAEQSKRCEYRPRVGFIIPGIL